MAFSIQPPSLPIPVDLHTELADPLMPWHASKRFSDTQSIASHHSYKKVQVLPTDPEWRFVWRYFHRDKPIKYDLTKVYYVCNSDQIQDFESNLLSMEQEASNSNAKLSEEHLFKLRALVMERWNQICDTFPPVHIINSKRSNQKLRPLHNPRPVV